MNDSDRYAAWCGSRFHWDGDCGHLKVAALNKELATISLFERGLKLRSRKGTNEA